jgi:lipid II:glycine glycyltransferase (peptidoglycan interpeptide bridge formation enzyme)
VEVREATVSQLPDWDDLAVRSAHGHVYQSRAWAAYRAAFGWQPRFLVADDGAPILALARPWPLVGSDGIYVSRGPLPDADPARTLARLEAVTRWFAERGASVVSADPEVPAESPYRELLTAAGFRQIEEIQPSRHRLAVDLANVSDAAELLASFGATTRNMIRAAERTDLRLVRFGPIDDAPSPPADEPAPAAELQAELTALYGLMSATATRRGFGLASRERFVDWSGRAYAAGHLAYIGGHDTEGQLVAGATFYRHGRRWTYANAADDPRFRKTYPGAVRQVVWEALQAALAEGRTEMDLGGVDVPGARRRPVPGEPAHGMLAFKESFGARWIELTGAHERVLRPTRYGLGRVTGRIASALGRGTA